MNTLRKLGWSLSGVAILAFAASPVWAHCGKCAGDCKAMVEAMDAGKTSAGSIIAAAEEASKGKAIGMVSSLDKGKMTAKVYCVTDGKVQTVDVGADGKAGKPEEMKDGDGRIAQMMESAKMTAAKVIEAAEEHSKGKALAMVGQRRGSDAIYEVYTLAEEKIQKVSINESGKPTGMSEAQTLPDQIVRKRIRGG